MSRERYNLSVAVFVLLLRGDELCMLRRANTGWMDGYFSLPAGGLEKGETLSVAASRELKEETGIEVLPSELILAHSMHVWTDNRSWMGHYFICRKWAENLSLLSLTNTAKLNGKEYRHCLKKQYPTSGKLLTQLTLTKITQSMAGSLRA